MRTSKVLSFEELLAIGVSLDDSQIVSFDKVEIPKIQRAYAQGRNDAANVRDGILKNIFDSLEQDKEIQFSFIYGSKSDTWNSFELLDGQQRLTTLFLVHWYILKVEADELPDYLTKFSYQTRDSSKIFIENLCNKKDLSLKGLEGDATPFTDVTVNQISGYLHELGYQKYGNETVVWEVRSHV